MEPQQSKDGLRIVRVDRITSDEFPVKEGNICLGRAKVIADEETNRRKPQGDIFVVKDSLGRVVYKP